MSGLDGLRRLAEHRPTVAPVAKHKKGGWGQILPGLGHALTSLPAGVLHLASGALRTTAGITAAPIRSTWDAIHGHPVKGLKRLGDTLTLGFASEGAMPGGFEQAAPLAAELGSSIFQTGLHLRHPTTYREAWRNGEIVPLVIGDVGNVAIVGGGAAKALGAAGSAAEAAGATRLGAGLTAAGENLGRIGTVANRAVDASTGLPALRAAARTIAGEERLPVLRLGVAKARAAASGALFAEGAPLEKWGRMYPRALTNEGVALQRNVLAPTERAANIAGHRIGRGMQRATGAASTAEQEAAIAIHLGDAAHLAQIEDAAGARGLQGFDPAAVEAAMTPRREPGHYTSDEGAKLGVDVLRGAADPQVAARVQRMVDELKVRDQEATRLAQAGVGRDNPLSQANVDRLPEVTPEAIAANPALQSMTPAELAAITDPTSYPSVWRPHIVRAQRLADTIERTGGDASWIPRTPAEMAAAGMTPGYLPAVPFDRAGEVSRIAQRVEPGAGALPGDRRLANEYTRSGEGGPPRTIGGVAGQLGKQAEQAWRNQGYRDVIASGRTPGAVLDPATIATLEQDARAAALDYIGNVADPRQAAAIEARAYATEYGNRVVQAMRDKGLEAWVTDGDMTRPLYPNEITPTTPFLPIGLRDALAPWMRPIQNRGLLRVLERINARWKGAVLPWSVRWQVGDAVSNALMAWTAGNINPYDLFQRMRQARALTKTAEGARLLDNVLNEQGLHFDTADFIHGGRYTGNQPARRHLPVVGEHRPIKAVTAKSYAFNQWLNELDRHGVFLENLQRELDQRGIGLDIAGDTARLADATPTTDPHVYQAIEHAVDQTNTILGDMTTMTPIERRVIRQVFPFWAWTRHVIQLAARLPVDHPMRALMIMHIGELAGTDSDVPDFLAQQGAVHGPGGWWNTNFVNPLADVGGIPGLTKQSLLRSTSPVFKVAGAALLGQDWNRGGLPLSHPPGQGELIDEYGRNLGLNWLKDPASVLYQGLKQIPQSRTLLNLLPTGNRLGIATGPVQRYGTGDAITSAGHPRRLDEGRLKLLAGGFGIPYPQSDAKIEQLAATIEKRRRRRRAARKATA